MNQKAESLELKVEFGVYPGGALVLHEEVATAQLENGEEMAILYSRLGPQAWFQFKKCWYCLDLIPIAKHLAAVYLGKAS